MVSASRRGPDWAERTTTDRSALLETLQADAPVGLGFIDREFRQVFVNTTLAAIRGSTIAEQLGQRVTDLVPQLWAQLEPLYRHVLDTGEAVLDVEVTGRTAADPLTTRHWLSSYYPISLRGEIVGIGMVIADITERRVNEQAHRQLAAIVEDSGDAIFGSTLDGIVTSWNASAQRLFGYTAKEIIGQPTALIAPPDRLAEQAQIRARIGAAGLAEHHETRRRSKDGNLFDVSVTTSPAIDQAGNVVGISVIVRDIAVRLGVQRELAASERRLADAQRIAEIGSFERDFQTGVLTWSLEHYRILGLDPHLAAHGDLILALVHNDDRAALGQAWAGATERGVGFDLNVRVIRPDSEQRWVSIRAVVELGDDGTVLRLSGTLRDITDRVEALRVRHEAEARFEAAFEQAGIGAAIVDLDGIPMRVNAAVCTLLGRPKELLIGHEWNEYDHPDELPIGPAMRARGVTGLDTYTDERRFIRPDGSIVWAAFHGVLVRDEAGNPLYSLAQLQDITERKAVEAELAHQALHDSLTGLPNRTLLSDRLVHGLAGARRRGTQLGVIFLDIDHFKEVNDLSGHAVGDRVLRHVVDRISGVLRASDTVARVGGDEFVIVCGDTLLQGVQTIAQRVLAAVSETCVIAGQEMTVTASIGIVLSDEQSTPEGLLRDSDAAMYLAKGLGRNRIEFFDDTLRAKTEDRLATASALRHALERGEFTIHYQPIVNIATGAMVSAEALLRWDSPDRGRVSPAEFIPITEETGLIIPIGAWVFEQACLQLIEWQHTDPSMSVAVNLSVRQVLSAGIVAQLQDVITRTGVRPDRVCLELTESVFMGDVDYFARTLADLKALGVRLSIDDFGTGYSSLSYLKQFPVDEVKIDKTFVDGLGTDPNDSALVAAIIAMADALGLGVIAEGVETPEQFAILKQLHCERAQGFLLARPMPADLMGQLVTQSRRWQIG